MLLVVGTIAAAATERGNTRDGNGPYKGYHFVLTIENNHDSVMYMGNYYAGKTYATDTAYRNRKGQFVFDRKTRPIFPGVYFFTNPAGDYVEFMVYHEKPDFTFVTEERQWTQSMKVKGSRQNDLFYQYNRLNRHYYQVIEDASASMPDSTFRLFRDKTMREFDSVQQQLIKDNPTSLLAKMLQAGREPSTPSQDSTGRELTQLERYTWFLDHYFDNTPLDDDALIRTPESIFHHRLTNWLDKYMKNATPDFIIERLDRMLDKAEASPENFRYLVHTISEKYLQSNIMSYDAIYVHMIKTYYGTGRATWASPSTIDENMERASKWEKLLIGKDAPELVLKDHDGAFHSLHQQQAKYTLLLFWSPTCGHCKVMIPDLYKKFMAYKDTFDIRAFTILSEPDEATRAKWLDFIKVHSFNDPRWLNLDGGEANVDWHEVYDVETTPQIYLLDRDKHILAKKLNAELFEEIILTLEKEGR